MKKVTVPTINNFGPIQTKEGEYIEEKVKIGRASCRERV